MVQHLYGISWERYYEMYREQDGKCAICRRPGFMANRGPKNRRLAVDHDHNTGKVRGLLCVHCNSMIGYAQDNPELLRAGTLYLVKTLQ